MFKKILSMALALLMVLGMCAAMSSCKKPTDADLQASPLPAPTLTKDFEVKEGLKIGFIFLHDEKSTYDKNFMDAADEVQKLLGLSDDQVLR